jgi:multiple sugar transport system permease protein
VTQGAINFFGEKPLALIMVTVFEIWRYFPLSFLFILARMQSIDQDMYEAADMDGASPFQKFWYLALPQLLGILSVLFLLRFIWTFNKFDDIFLLTGGNAGTRTLTVNVYEQAFALSNIGAGAAVAVVIFGCLLVVQLRLLPLYEPGGRAVSGPAPRRGHAASNRRGNAGQRVVWAPLACGLARLPSGGARP